MTYEEFVANRIGSLASSGSDDADVNIGEAPAGQSHLDEPYEIYLNDAGEKCVRIGSVSSRKFMFMSYDMWKLLSAEHGLSLDDEDIVDFVQRVYAASFVPIEDVLFPSRWEDDLV